MIYNNIRQDRKGYNLILYEQHLQRLQNAKSSLDTSKPKKLSFPKKREIEYNRNVDHINNSNCKIVDRLINVTSSLDNKPNKHMKEIIAFKNKMVIHKRKMEIQKLVCENILLTDRLKTVKPCIKF